MARKKGKSAAGRRNKNAGLTIDTNIGRAAWEELHSAPAGGNTYESFQRPVAMPASSGTGVPPAWTSRTRPRGCRAGRSSKERAKALADAAIEVNAHKPWIYSPQQQQQQLRYTPEQLVHIQEQSASNASGMSSHPGLVKVDNWCEIKELGKPGHEDPRMLLTVTTLTPGEMSYISTSNAAARMPLSELHLANSRARQEHSEDDHDLVTVQRGTRPLHRSPSLSPEFLSKEAGLRHQMIEEGRATRQLINQDPGTTSITKKTPKMGYEDIVERSPRRSPDDRFSSLLTRLRPFVGSSSKTSSAGSEFGIRNGIYPPKEKKDKKEDKSKTFNPNATEFVPVNSEMPATVGAGFGVKPIGFMRKAVTGIFSPQVSAASIIPSAQTATPIPAVPLDMIDPAIIAYSPARAPNALPPMPMPSMPAPSALPNFGFGGLGGLGGLGQPQYDITTSNFFMGAPGSPLGPPIGLGIGAAGSTAFPATAPFAGPVPVPATFPAPPPAAMPSFLPAPIPFAGAAHSQFRPPAHRPVPVRKPRVPDTMSQMQYEQYLEERRAMDPNGYAIECKRRQAKRFLRQKYPPGHPDHKPLGSA